ncbi:MAG: hypothetical protein MZV63_41355 [Marinilabiliales bacterium]|nr:hypothetical protein [Marinilabiliales bacterium]
MGRRPGHSDYVSRMFYRQQRKFLRVAADFQGKFFAENLRWLAGAAYLQVTADSVDIARLNKGKKEENMLPGQHLRVVQPV